MEANLPICQSQMSWESARATGAPRWIKDITSALERKMKVICSRLSIYCFVFFCCFDVGLLFVFVLFCFGLFLVLFCLFLSTLMDEIVDEIQKVTD